MNKLVSERWRSLKYQRRNQDSLNKKDKNNQPKKETVLKMVTTTTTTTRPYSNSDSVRGTKRGRACTF
jgi:hypothetical protein